MKNTRDVTEAMSIKTLMFKGWNKKKQFRCQLKWPIVQEVFVHISLKKKNQYETP